MSSGLIRSPSASESSPRSPLRAPATRLGKASLVLLGAGVGFLAIFALAVAVGVRGSSPLALEIAFLAIPLVCGFGSFIGAGVVAVVAVFRRERSLLLALPIIVGALALLFVVGELASPH